MLGAGDAAMNRDGRAATVAVGRSSAVPRGNAAAEGGGEEFRGARSQRADSQAPQRSKSGSDAEEQATPLTAEEIRGGALFRAHCRVYRLVKAPAKGGGLAAEAEARVLGTWERVGRGDAVFRRDAALGVVILSMKNRKGITVLEHPVNPNMDLRPDPWTPLSYAFTAMDATYSPDRRPQPETFGLSFSSAGDFQAFREAYDRYRGMNLALANSVPASRPALAHAAPQKTQAPPNEPPGSSSQLTLSVHTASDPEDAASPSPSSMAESVPLQAADRAAAAMLLNTKLSLPQPSETGGPTELRGKSDSVSSGASAASSSLVPGGAGGGVGGGELQLLLRRSRSAPLQAPSPTASQASLSGKRRRENRENKLRSMLGSNLPQEILEHQSETPYKPSNPVAQSFPRFRALRNVSIASAAPLEEHVAELETVDELESRCGELQSLGDLLSLEELVLSKLVAELSAENEALRKMTAAMTQRVSPTRTPPPRLHTLLDAPPPAAHRVSIEGTVPKLPSPQPSSPASPPAPVPPQPPSPIPAAHAPLAPPPAYRGAELLPPPVLPPPPAPPQGHAPAAPSGSSPHDSPSGPGKRASSPVLVLPAMSLDSGEDLGGSAAVATSAAAALAATAQSRLLLPPRPLSTFVDTTGELLKVSAARGCAPLAREPLLTRCGVRAGRSAPWQVERRPPHGARQHSRRRA